ncbi:cyclin-domain-containing protein [Xylaria intraflava]|nr:cyclin-domain-containing protein [Xylaria intraflava]
MLTSSPVAPLPMSASPAAAAAPRDFGYASRPPPPSTRSPHQSPKITAPLRRRHSKHSVYRPSPSPPGSHKSPLQPKPRQYVGVDAATQYSPMEPFDPMVPLRAADAPSLRKPTSTSTAENTEKKPVSPSTPVEPPAERSLQPARPDTQPANPLSPSKRRNSQDHGILCAVEASQCSSPKRTRTNTSPPKVLPSRYELCDVEDMVILIANMIGELIETNDSLAMKSGNLTRFHSRTAPGISVLDYLQRLAKHATLTPPLLLSMVYYIDRLCALYTDFTINTLTVHRFLITSATVAGKGLSDSFWNNSYYARVGGVKVAELKLLELEFLYRVDWRIVPIPEVLEAYYKGLVDRCDGYVIQEEAETAPSEDEETDEIDDEEDSDVPIRKKSQQPVFPQQRPIMRTATILAGLAWASSLASASERTAAIYIQAISATPASPVPLAELQYDALAPADAQVLAYEAPELSPGTKLVRVGVYDPAAKDWASSTSVAAVENFDKGFSPALMVSVDRAGVPVSAAVRGVRIDAGQTRDFGPQAVILVAEAGAQPDLNKPVVLSPEGKQVVPEEKTMFQKYWWVIAIVVMMSVLGGGDDKKE